MRAIIARATLSLAVLLLGCRASEGRAPSVDAVSDAASSVGLVAPPKPTAFPEADAPSPPCLVADLGGDAGGTGVPLPVPILPDGGRPCGVDTTLFVLVCLEQSGNLLACANATASGECAECAVGGPNELKPLVRTSNGVRLNTAACIYALDPARSFTCVQQAMQFDHCIDLSCGACLQTSSADAYETCALAARMGACAPYYAGVADCIDPTRPRARFASCWRPGQFGKRAEFAIRLACEPVDAGTD